MKDFYPYVKQEIKNDSIERLLEDFNADKNIKLSTSSRPVIITPYAFYESESKYDSLEFIFRRSNEIHREIPFAGVINEEDLVVSEFIKGKIGDAGECDWYEGQLLKKAYEKASKISNKVSLGHTHPKGFGAVCSKVYYDAKDLRWFVREKNNSTSKRMLETEIYNHFGGDYSIMFTMAHDIPLISDYFWIMSPGEDQVGVFEVKEEGKIIYHPWRIQE